MKIRGLTRTRVVFCTVEQNGRSPHLDTLSAYPLRLHRCHNITRGKRYRQSERSLCFLQIYSSVDRDDDHDNNIRPFECLLLATIGNLRLLLLVFKVTDNNNTKCATYRHIRMS